MRFRHLTLFAAALLAAGPASAAVTRAGFNGNALPAGDDISSADTVGAVNIGFNANFFGTSYTQLFVNNNGNVTFNGPLAAFTPIALTTATGVPIIAPFFADVDTTNTAAVTYGTGTVNGHPAFGVNYPDVACYNFQSTTTQKNIFQVILIDRSDTGAGNFDIEYNYDKIQWEAGEFSGGSPACLGGDSARIGFSKGTGAAGTFFEFNGSGVNSAFLDSNTKTGLIYNSAGLGSPTGRYVYAVRNGNPMVPQAINNKFAAPVLSTPIYSAGSGIYRFSAQYCRTGSNAYFDLFSEVAALTNNNNLLSRTSDSPTPAQPGGPGARQKFALVGGYADGLLSLGECTTENYVLGLSNSNRFTFRVLVDGTQQ